MDAEKNKKSLTEAGNGEYIVSRVILSNRGGVSTAFPLSVICAVTSSQRCFYVFFVYQGNIRSAAELNDERIGNFKSLTLFKEVLLCKHQFLAVLFKG
jgi:hypothetical protein